MLRAARAQGRGKAPPAPLTRTQSDGSVAPSAGGSGRLHASSLSVNDADDFDSEYERDHSVSLFFHSLTSFQMSIWDKGLPYEIFPFFICGN